MIKGVGIDSVSISKTDRLIDALGLDYLNHVYSVGEIEDSHGAIKRAEFFASRFAVKEAAYKALAHITPEHDFDMRCIEVANASDGSPSIVEGESLLRVMGSAEVTCLFVSISTENDLATAIVIAEG